jgi:cytochrome c553
MALNRRRTFIAIILLALGINGGLYARDGADTIKQRIGIGNPVAGKSKSTLCQSCHGEDGLSMENLIPHLAGQYAAYISKEVLNFQSGVRKHPIMSVMAKSINDADLDDIAAYFASQDTMQGGGWGASRAAKKLFLEGDRSRSIPSCASCHGVNGKGNTIGTQTFPVIGGQHEAYLSEQLVNWRSGERTNSPDGVMNKIAKALTDKEIESLSEYISGL